VVALFRLSQNIGFGQPQGIAPTHLKIYFFTKKNN